MVYDIVTFGSAVVDVFISSTEYDKKSKSFVFKSGEKILVDDMKEDIGGGSINTSVGFSRMGFKTGCICKVGRDSDGKDILKLLENEKVSFLGSITKDGKTGHSIILDYPRQDRTILKYNGYCGDMKVSEVKPFKTKWLYYSSLAGNACDAQEKLARRMKKVGVRLAFNPSAYLAKRINIMPVLKMTDILVLNKEEAKIICSKYGVRGDVLKGLRSLGPEIVVITNGAKTVVASDGVNKYSIEPLKRIKIVERTGAGDAFAVGFVSGVMSGKNVDSSLKLGIKLSTTVLGAFGARNKIPKLNIKGNSAPLGVPPK